MELNCGWNGDVFFFSSSCFQSMKRLGRPWPSHNQKKGDKFNKLAFFSSINTFLPALIYGSGGGGGCLSVRMQLMTHSVNNVEINDDCHYYYDDDYLCV